MAPQEDSASAVSTNVHIVPPSLEVIDTMLGDAGFQNIVHSIKTSLARRHHHLEPDELEGFAQLGVARARAKLDPKRFVGEGDIKKRVCSYLLTKGKQLAIDEMRSEKYINRFRNGKWYGGTVQATRFSELENPRNHPSSVAASHDGFASLEISDLVQTISGKLIGPEKVVFDAVYIEGVVPMRVAERLKCSTAYVYVLHDRLLAKLRDYLTSGASLAA